MERNERKCTDIPFEVVEALLDQRRNFEWIARAVADEDCADDYKMFSIAMNCGSFAEQICDLLSRYGYHFMYDDLWDPAEKRICALDQIHEEALREQRRRTRL